jgi:FkbM family methyltransferase
MTPKQFIRGIAIKGFNIAKAMIAPDIKFPDNRLYVKSYSQYGEDLLVDAILGCKPRGTYVDIGANDPSLFSNTKRFYERGWGGINIEPNPLHFPVLLKNRPRDINLNIGISDKESTLPFYILKADMVSTLDKNIAIRNCQDHDTSIQNVIEVPVSRLDITLDTYLGSRTIDFMSIDVEGAEMLVLGGNDWSEYRPQVIVIEIQDHTENILDYLTARNYLPILSNGTNAIFIDRTNSEDVNLISKEGPNGSGEK